MEISLINLPEGKKAVIKKLEGGREFLRKLEALNIRVGKIIKKITGQPFRGPIVIEVDNTKVAIGRGMAMRIYVEPEK